jgi:CheY-like chemotaxis protein
MDGLSATRSIRQERANPEYPWIIAVTAYAMAGDRERCLAAGMNDYISKPIRESELIEALQKIRLPSQAIALTELVSPTVNPNVTREGEELVLDSKVLQAIRDMGGSKAEAVLNQLIREYLETLPHNLQQIQQAIAGGNLETLRRSAHGLGSSSANLGAVKFARICKQLENIGRSGVILGADTKFTELEAEYKRVKTELMSQLERKLS